MTLRVVTRDIITCDQCGRTVTGTPLTVSVLSKDDFHFCNANHLSAWAYAVETRSEFPRQIPLKEQSA